VEDVETGADLGGDEEALASDARFGDGGTQLGLFAARDLLAVVKSSVNAPAASRKPGRERVGRLGSAARAKVDAWHLDAWSDFDRL
jgi:hypothetical protein